MNSGIDTGRDRETMVPGYIYTHRYRVNRNKYLIEFKGSMVTLEWEGLRAQGFIYYF